MADISINGDAVLPKEDGGVHVDINSNNVAIHTTPQDDSVVVRGKYGYVNTSAGNDTVELHLQELNNGTQMVDMGEGDDTFIVHTPNNVTAGITRTNTAGGITLTLKDGTGKEQIFNLSGVEKVNIKQADSIEAQYNIAAKVNSSAEISPP